MKQKLIVLLVAVTSLLAASSVQAQRKKQKQDTLGIYREFARIGEWYEQLPVRMNLKFVHQTVPANQTENSQPTDMVVYYGKSDFYMQAEGLEQIANDSLIVLVNAATKMIRLYPNDSAMQRRLQQAILLYKPDSSFKELVQRYVASMVSEDQSSKQITLQSRDKLFGTAFPKETISISYQPGTFQPKVFDQVKRSLVLIDVAMYQRLQNNPEYSGRLVQTKAKGAELFFMVKEIHTNCRFTEVSHELGQPPVRQQDRIVKVQDGSFQPVRGFEDYVLSKEF